MILSHIEVLVAHIDDFVFPVVFEEALRVHEVAKLKYIYKQLFNMDNYLIRGITILKFIIIYICIYLILLYKFVFLNKNY